MSAATHLEMKMDNVKVSDLLTQTLQHTLMCTSTKQYLFKNNLKIAHL